MIGDTLYDRFGVYKFQNCFTTSTITINSNTDIITSQLKRKADPLSPEKELANAWAKVMKLAEIGLKESEVSTHVVENVMEQGETMTESK